MHGGQSTGPGDRRVLGVDGAEGLHLEVEVSGSGLPVVLLHGLTATRRYVVMGSNALQRSGHRVIAYDARGHGRSAAAAPGPAAYNYANLEEDLLAVLDRLEVGRALIAGASMGAHTALRFALAHPDRVAALGIITPSYDPDAPAEGDSGSEDWEALAAGLRRNGIDGFVAAYDFSAIPETWRETVERVIRQRLAEHLHPEAVADALEGVPRSRPFRELAELASLSLPVLVVASRDEADPGHPLAVGERYASVIPGARLLVERPPPPLRSPIAWQGGRLSEALIALAVEAGL